ncbi:MAG: hypothetical protein EHM72_09940 [Calditrichaeota bacterium]|nr:MAG: hypothetical protein EHM72_09940 [Calditrichota bacterium]
MNQRIRTLTLIMMLIGTIFLLTPLNARPPASQTGQIIGKVYSLSNTGEKKPESKLVVSMDQTGNSDDTNDQGIFYLDLPTGYRAGESVNLSISKKGWRLVADGRVRIPYDLREIIEIELIPVNQQEFWTEVRVANLIKTVADKSTQQEPLKSDSVQVDLSRYIKDWAVQYGFSAQQAKEEIDKWAAEIEAQSDNDQGLGLAAFAKKNFGQAAHYFETALQAKTAQMEEIRRQKEALAEMEAKLTGDIIESSRLSGNAYFGNNQFDKALQAFQQAQSYVDKEKSPDEWAGLALSIGNSAMQLGNRIEGAQIQILLQLAVQTYRQVIEIWSPETNPEGWARTQNNLGNTLRNLGMRTDGQEGLNLLAQAKAAYENALTVYTRGQYPQDWAMTENNLGILLNDLGTHTEEDEGRNLLAQARIAYENALEVYTRGQYPFDWAMTQNNLGNALRNLGMRTEGDEGLKWLTLAKIAFENTLQVNIREQRPQEWAMIQNNLGTVLRSLGARSDIEEAAELMTQAVAAYQNALQVYTREQLPQDWAMTQNNLGVVWNDMGAHTDGEEGSQLLARAVTAFENALEVYTQAELPLDWGMTLNNLAIALTDLGTRTDGEEGLKLLTRAKIAYENALEVYTREQYPLDWAMTQNNLGIVLNDLGTSMEGEEGVKLLAQAAAAYENALEIYTREDLPLDWAMTQNNRGIVLSDLGVRTEDERGGMKLLAQAKTAYEDALNVYTREQFPLDWAMTQNNRGTVLRELGERTEGEERERLLAQAVEILEQSLQVRTFNYLPIDWAESQGNLAETYTLLKNWPTAAESYANVLKVYPEDEKSYQKAAHLYQEVIFNFPEAFALNQNWLEEHGDDLVAQCDFAEKHFTTGRFKKCRDRIIKLMADPSLEPGRQIPLRAIGITVSYALGEIQSVPQEMERLEKTIGLQEASFKLNRSFDGVKHFISGNEDLAPYRNWLLSLFNALQGDNREMILNPLKELRSNIPTLKE